MNLENKNSRPSVYGLDCGEMRSIGRKMNALYRRQIPERLNRRRAKCR